MLQEDKITYEDLQDDEKELIHFLRKLDENYRHSFTLVCQGNHPVSIMNVEEHRDIDLRTK